MSGRDLTFSAEERARLADVCKALGTTFAEVAHFATMRAVDECEGYARDAGLIRAFYEGTLSDADVGAYIAEAGGVRPWEVG